VVLYTCPTCCPRRRAGCDLVLSGHTHGGQWRLPGFGALLTNSRYGKRYEAGHYRRGDTHLVVSRGLGMEGFGMPRARFFCPPEVALITLSRAASMTSGSTTVSPWLSLAALAVTLLLLLWVTRWITHACISWVCAGSTIRAWCCGFYFALILPASSCTS